MRVALVSPGYPPDRGGVEQHVRGIARALADLGVETEVLTYAKSKRPIVGTDGDVTVRRWPAYGLGVDFNAAPGIARYLYHNGAAFDVVHSHNYHSATFAFALAAEGVAARVVSPFYHGVGSSRLSNALHPMYRLLSRRVLRGSQAVVAASVAEAELLRGDFPFVNPVVIPCAVTTVSTGRHAESRQLLGGEPVILSVGRLVEYKRVDRLLEALPLLAGAILVVVGEGNDAKRLHSLARALRVSDRVRFVGALSDAQLACWYQEASLVVSLSEQESFGLVPLEALSLGLPVVVSSIDTHRELVGFDSAGGLRFVDADVDSAELAEVLASALRAGRLPPSDLIPTPDRIGRELVSVYESAAQRFRGGRRRRRRASGAPSPWGARNA